MTWRDHAACRGHDTDRWFPRRGEANSTDHRATVRVCERCPVREPCLEYALDHAIKEGLWGGLSERQRKRIRSQRSRSSTAHAGGDEERQEGAA